MVNHIETISTALFNEVLNGSGGGTYSVLTGEKIAPATGYLIGLKGGFEVPKSYFLNSKYPIKVLFDQINLFGLNRLNYIGFWVNENKVYLDPVIHLTDKNQSLQIAALNGQLSIWDCKENEVINLFGLNV